MIAQNFVIKAKNIKSNATEGSPLGRPNEDKSFRATE
jgi:hypothetical protein